MTRIEKMKEAVLKRRQELFKVKSPQTANDAVMLRNMRERNEYINKRLGLNRTMDDYCGELDT